MLKILLPVDGSENSDKAIVEFMKLLNWYKEMPEIHLLTVQMPLSGNISSYISATDIKQYHQEEGLKSLENARKLLDQAGVAYQYHITVRQNKNMTKSSWGHVVKETSRVYYWGQ